MAGIDKIYGTRDQYDELYNWLKGTKKKSALKWFYSRPPDDWIKNHSINPIASFPASTDYWLRLNCPIRWVLERLDKQYNMEYKIKTYEAERSRPRC